MSFIFKKCLFLIAYTINFKLYVLYDQFEEAAKEVADEVTRPRPEGDEELQDIQVMLTSKANPASMRALKVSIEPNNSP